VDVYDRQSDLALAADCFAPLVQAILAGEEARADEVALHFVSMEEIAQLHADHFSDPSPTDCISFPMDGPDEPYRVLGEVVVCPKMAVEYVEKEGGDIFEEVALYVVHGILHLLGYEDLSQEQALRMRAAERRYVADIIRCGKGMRRVR
jgi:probable rRNA maturation factor